MKIKHIIRFTLACALYVVTYFLLCIVLEIGGRDRIMDHHLLSWALICSPLKFQYSVQKLSPNLFLWICLSFALIPYILEQTTISGPKRNRAALKGLGMNLLLVCLPRGIADWIEIDAAAGIFDILVALIALFTVIGLGISLSYWIKKRNGRFNSHEAYSDIMTQEEFSMWQSQKIMRGRNHSTFIRRQFLRRLSQRKRRQYLR